MPLVLNQRTCYFAKKIAQLPQVTDTGEQVIGDSETNQSRTGGVVGRDFADESVVEHQKLLHRTLLAHIWQDWTGQEVIGHVDEIKFGPRPNLLRQRTRQLVLIQRVIHQLLELAQFGRYLPSKVVFIQLQAHQVGREPQLLLIAFEMVFRSIKHLELLEVYETRRKFSCERVIVKLKLP